METIKDDQTLAGLTKLSRCLCIVEVPYENKKNVSRSTAQTPGLPNLAYRSGYIDRVKHAGMALSTKNQNQEITWAVLLL